jgi:hypothetical protein
MNFKKNYRLLTIIISVLFILLSCCDRPKNEGHKNPPVKNNKININLYIENSMSMNGFWKNPNSDFRNDIRDFAADLKNDTNIKINYFYINDSVYKIETDNLGSYINDVNANKGNTKSSDLNNIFQQLIKNIDSNSINILISDNIYSKNTDPKSHKLGTLDENRTKSKEHFSNAKNKNLITAVAKFKSQFNGTLYNPKPKNHNNTFFYYMTMIGQPSSMSKLFSLLDNKWNNYKGYIDRILYSKSKDNNVDAFVHNELIKDAQTSKENNTIENANIGSEFLILCDLSSYKGIESRYLCDSSNYELSDSSYSVVEINKIENFKIKFNGKEKTIENTKFDKCTHTIKIKINKMQFSDIILKLRFKQPEWESHNDPNANNIIDATYGIKDLLIGIMDGYELDNNKKYFIINISKN